MFRLLVLILFVIAARPSIAQALEDTPADPAQNDQSSRNHVSRRSRPPSEPRISIARLRVSHKARRLYEKALAVWRDRGPADAQRIVEKALKIDPAFPEALVLYGYIRSSHQDWDSAEHSLQAAIRSDPSYSPAYIILASAYNEQHRYDDAQEATQNALSAGADIWKVQYEIARVLIGRGEYENALAVTEEALRSKHLPLMHVAKAHALLGLRRYPEAATELRAYLRNDPSGDGSQDARHILDRLQGIAAQ